MANTDIRDDQTCLGCANCKRLYLSHLSECPFCHSKEVVGDITDPLEGLRGLLKHGRIPCQGIPYVVNAIEEIERLRLKEDMLSHKCGGKWHPYPSVLCSSCRGEKDVEEHHGEAVAKRFYEIYERLAPEFGYETKKDSAVPWDEVPQNNRHLMIATCRELLRKGI